MNLTCPFVVSTTMHIDPVYFLQHLPEHQPLLAYSFQTVHVAVWGEFLENLEANMSSLRKVFSFFNSDLRSWLRGYQRYTVRQLIMRIENIRSIKFLLLRTVCKTNTVRKLKISKPFSLKDAFSFFKQKPCPKVNPWQKSAIWYYHSSKECQYFCWISSMKKQAQEPI